MSEPLVKQVEKSQTLPINAEDLYILFYRTGMNPRPLEMYFHFPEGRDDFRKVVERCKRFCDTTGYKFTKVEKFLTDLAAAEKRSMAQG